MIIIGRDFSSMMDEIIAINKQKSRNQSTKDILRCGIMGGTFDPIHFGHLTAANTVLESMHLDQIIFIPTGQPPHKNDRIVTNAQDRYRMTLLATYSHPDFYVSRIEIERQGYTYTKDTLSELMELYQQNIELFFIIGTDSLYQISTWKDPQRIFELCQVVVVNRGNNDLTELKAHIRLTEKTYKTKVHLVRIPALEISSTQIREKVRNHQSITYLLPEVVEKYIYNQELYIE